MEQWRDIPGYVGLYQVSDMGRVKSLSRPTPCKSGTRRLRERILRYQLSGTVGYPAVVIYTRGVPRTIAIHRLVMLAFVGEPASGMEVCHGNGDPTDNRLRNLRYDTRKANRLDGLSLGEIPLGEDRPQAKLTSAQVLAIRAAAKLGVPQRKIAAQFGVKQQAISKIVLRLRWAHIPDPDPDYALHDDERDAA